MRKVLMVALAVLIMTMLFPSGSLAARKIAVSIDGTVKEFYPAPVIQKGTTLVPMRAIFEELGAVVDWDPETWSVTATKDGRIISMTIGKRNAYVDGKEIALAVAPQVINGRTMVPLRFVSESLGAEVKWDSKNWSIFITSPVIPDQKENSEGPLSVMDIAKKSESVVLIRVFDRKGNELGIGSGFVVRENGVIATNYHVIEGAASASVNFEDGRSFEVRYVINHNAQRDIAVLKIDASGLPVLKTGDSAKLTRGEQVVAIGNPKGLQNTVSDGIVSATNRMVNGYNFIQFTAPISSGNSGGPLFNMKGEVIGINSLTRVDSQNINLAIPINEVTGLFDGGTNITLAELNKVPAVTMTDEDFKNYLFENYGSAKIGDYAIKADMVYFTQLEGSKAFALILNNENYLNFLLAVGDGGMAALEEWLQDMGNEAARNYPGEDVMISFLFSDYFYDYPSSFPARSIQYSNGKWQVTYIPVSVFVKGDGRMDIFWNKE